MERGVERDREERLEEEEMRKMKRLEKAGIKVLPASVRYSRSAWCRRDDAPACIWTHTANSFWFWCGVVYNHGCSSASNPHWEIQ